MLNSSSISPLQVQYGGDLVERLLQGMPTADLEAALLDENHPLAKDLQAAVMLAVDAGAKAARQIVVAALESVLRKRRADGR